jgi:hypothetical protein
MLDEELELEHVENSRDDIYSHKRWILNGIRFGIYFMHYDYDCLMYVAFLATV